MPDKLIEGVRGRDFAEWLAELDRGEVNHRLSVKLMELASAVEETCLAGKISVVFKIKKEGEVAVASVEVKVTKPEHPHSGTLFYFGENGALHREDPRQLKLRNLEQKKLRTISSAKPAAPADDPGDDEPGKGN